MPALGRSLLRGAAGDLAARGPAVAAQLTRLLYPQLDEQATLDRTDAFLAGPDVPAGCRRLVLEQRDDVARALRAVAAGLVTRSRDGALGRGAPVSALTVQVVGRAVGAAVQEVRPVRDPTPGRGAAPGCGRAAPRRGPGLDPGQRGAQAEVDAAAEGQVRLRPPAAGVELVRGGEHRGVPVGRAEGGEDPGPAGIVTPPTWTSKTARRKTPWTGASYRSVSSTTDPASRVGAQGGPQPRPAQQQHQRAADQVRGRLPPGEDQRDQQADHLRVGQRLAVGGGGEQVGEQVVAGGVPAGGDLRGQVALELDRGPGGGALLLRSGVEGEQDRQLLGPGPHPGQVAGRQADQRADHPQRQASRGQLGQVGPPAAGEAVDSSPANAAARPASALTRPGLNARATRSRVRRCTAGPR